MTDIDTVLASIDDAEVIQVTRDLVRIPTLTSREGMDIVRWFERWFADLGIPVRVYPAEDGARANFFADWGATSGPGRYLINGHMDIKPVDGMTVDPYGAEVRDGRMYGRGTCDMKGGIAAMLCAIKALVRAGHAPAGGITFYSDIEEEYGGGNGYYWAQREGMFDGYEGLISAEPTLLEVQIGNRGCFATAFEARGRSAHSGLAHLGVNAVHNMVRFITEYLELPYLKVENPYFGRCTVNFERIQGGLYLSAVPDRCVACVDSRLIPETPPEVVQADIDMLIARLAEEGIDIREIAEPPEWRPATFKKKAEAIPADHPLTHRVAAAVESVTGAPATISGCPAVTIAMVLINMGIPAVICGPGGIAQAHTEDEWVELDQLTAAARVYTTLLAEM